MRIQNCRIFCAILAFTFLLHELVWARNITLQEETMARISMPPGGVHTLGLITQCVAIDDVLYIDVDDAGYFAHSAEGYFSPDLPDGYELTDDPSQVAHKPLKLGDVILA